MKRAKKLLSLLLAIALVLTIVPWSSIVASASSIDLVLNEDGYYEISTADDLYEFEYAVNEGNNQINGILTNDIEFFTQDDLGMPEIDPIGNSTYPYMGVFDGAGFSIKEIPFSYGDETALFGVNNGTIKNLTISDQLSEIDEFYGDIAGGICATNNGTIDNCHNTYNLTAYDYVGGIVGSNYGTVSNCTNYGDISGNFAVGGIVGLNYEGDILNCNNFGNIFGDEYSGGICGLCPGSTITKCYNAGAVSGYSSCIGGIVGGVGDVKLTVSYCYNTGDISGYSCVGGIGGSGFYIHSYNNFSTGSVVVSKIGDDYEFDGLFGELFWANTAYSPSAYLKDCVKDSEGSILTCCSDYDLVLAATEEQFASGEVAYFLNYGVTDGTQVWYQNIDNGESVDVMPQYLGATVYENEVCTSNGIKKVYSNTLTPIEHTFDNGFCSVCGEEKSPDLVTDKNYESLGLTEDYLGYYCIYTADELYWFVKEVNSGNVTINAVLMNDIVVNEGDLSGYDGASENTWREWYPIGNTSNAFRGIFDGAGHKISGLYFNDQSATGVGLFGYNKGTVKNVGVENSFIYGYDAVGGVCGFNDKGTITNCYNTGLVVGAFYNGGICGSNSGTITDCYNEGIVNASYVYLGGICGLNNGGEIKGCYNTGLIYGGSQMGGICGYNASGTILESYNTGTIYSVGGSYIGGVCGINSDTVSKSYNTGDVTGKTSYGDGGSYIGGVCGYNQSTIQNCYNIGEINGASNVGGVCGDGLANNCYYLINCSTDKSGIVQSEIGTETTAEQFASGEICYALNDGVTDGTQVWYQNIDNGEFVDTAPKFVGGTVLKLVNGDEVAYSNVCDHNFENGVCSICGTGFTGVVGNYIYKNGVQLKAYQLVEVDGEFYYIGDRHQIVKNKKVYIKEERLNGLTYKDGTPLKAGYYEFDENGKIVILEGIVDNFVYKHGVQLKAYQLVEVDGDFYYIGDRHQIVKNKKVYIKEERLNGLTYKDGTPLKAGYYEFDENGKIVILEGIVDNFVYKHGVQLKAYQLVEVDGDFYYIGDRHQIVKNKKVYIKEERINGLTFADGTPITAGYYDFDADGKLILE